MASDSFIAFWLDVSFKVVVKVSPIRFLSLNKMVYNLVFDIEITNTKIEYYTEDEILMKFLFLVTAGESPEVIGRL